MNVVVVNIQEGSRHDQGPAMTADSYGGRRAVLVTGASTGLGRASARLLAERGYFVWAGVRRSSDAEALEQELGPSGAALLMDVTDTGAVDAAVRRVRDAGPLHGLVNNAGIAVPAPLEYLPLDEFRRQIEVNLTGQLAVTQAALPALRAGKGRIVVIGSIGGRIAGPLLGAYHASKFAIAGLTEALRAELAPSGLRVILIEPGAVATPIWSRGTALSEELSARMPDEATTRYRKMIDIATANAQRAAKKGLPPEEVAALIARVLTERNPRPRYLVGRDARVLAVVARLPERLRARLILAGST